jgi:hypothetical protein
MSQALPGDAADVKATAHLRTFRSICARIQTSSIWTKYPRVMSQILIHVSGVILGALALSLLGLNTRRVVISHSRPVGWVWKAMALLGKFLFYYGLLVLVSNLLVSGPRAENTGIGAAIFTLGLIAWAWGGLVIYFKKN